MAPKGGNAKKESGRAKKAENEAKKQEKIAADKVHWISFPSLSLTFIIFNPTQERKEEEKWQDGKAGKPKQEDREEKRKADLARKAENARLLAEEEASVSSKPKPAPKKKGTKDIKPAGPGAIAARGLSEPANPEAEGSVAVESYAATGIDNALDLLEVVTAKMDKASVGQQAAGLERHPEVSIIVCLSI